MDKNLVVSLDEIKGIRLQCKECGSEVVVSPTNPYPSGRACPQGHLWQMDPFSQKDCIYTFLSRDSPDQTNFPGYSSRGDTAKYNPAFQERQMRSDAA